MNIKALPNYITATRMIGTVALLFTTPLSLRFFIIYLITGITDILDGFLARKLKVTSDFGAKLDSVADLLFYSVMFFMLMPTLWNTLYRSIWYAAAVALIIRLIAYLLAAIRFKTFASSHSVLNKITGVCVFIIPFLLLTPFTAEICWVICLVAIISSLNELLKYIKVKKTVK